MKRKSATERITCYMAEEKIFITQASIDLGIPEEKLRFQDGEELSAAEFLKLCSYLHVLPQDFW